MPNDVEPFLVIRLNKMASDEIKLLIGRGKIMSARLIAGMKSGLADIIGHVEIMQLVIGARLADDIHHPFTAGHGIGWKVQNEGYPGVKQRNQMGFDGVFQLGTSADIVCNGLHLIGV